MKKIDRAMHIRNNDGNIAFIKKAAQFTIQRGAGKVLRDLHNWRWNQ